METVTAGPATGHAHTHTIIFLHGRDSSAAEFKDELFESEASFSSGPGNSSDDDGKIVGGDRTLPTLLPGIRWVFPCADILDSKFGGQIRQWIDMDRVGGGDEEDPDNDDDDCEWTKLPMDDNEQGGRWSSLQSTMTRIRGIIDAEAELVPKEKIFLAGMSQGFVVVTLMAFFFSVSEPDYSYRHFAGIMGFSSWLPVISCTKEEEQRLAGISNQGSDDVLNGKQSVSSGVGEGSSSFFLAKVAAASSRAPLPDVPIMLQHCADDDLILVSHSRRLREALSDLVGYPAALHEYENGGHWFNEPQGIDDMVRLITQKIK